MCRRPSCPCAKPAATSVLSKNSKLIPAAIVVTLRAMLTALAVLALAATPQPPLYFEANVGQAAPEVLTRAFAGATRFEVTRSGLQVTAGSGTARIDFDRPRAPTLRFERALDARIRVLDAKGARELPVYERAVLEGLWPGIDLVLLSRDGRFAFDLLVAPGGDPSRARFRLHGDAAIDRESGSLIIKNELGELRLGRPSSFQGSSAAMLETAFELRGQDLTFRVRAYDRTQPLVIDPVVEYASYVSITTPTTLVAGDGRYVYFASTYGQTAAATDPRVYISKIDTTLTGQASVVWGAVIIGTNTTIGAQTQITPRGIDVDDNGRVLVCGEQSGFPVPLIDSDRNQPATARAGVSYGFVLSADGTMLDHVTTLGDSGANDCAFDVSNNSFYIVGRSDTGPPGNSIIPGMTGWGYLVQVLINDDPLVAGDDILFTSRTGINSTLGYRIAVDPMGNVIVVFATSNQTGPDVDAWVNASSFQTRNDEIAICKFATALGANALLGCTYLGGTSLEAQGPVTTDSQGNIYVLAHTNSVDFPVAPNGPAPIVNGLVVSRLSAGLSTLDMSYFFPANNFAIPADIQILEDGSIAVLDGGGGGVTWPFTACAVRTDAVGSNFAVLDSAGQNILYGTRLPGLNGTTIAPLSMGRVAVGGNVWADSLFTPYVNGFDTTPRQGGFMALNIGEVCLDLALTGISSTNLPAQGDVVSFNFTAANNGPDEARGSSFTFDAPPQLRVLAANINAGVCTISAAADHVSCALADLTATATAAIEISALAAQTGAGVVSAEISSGDIDLDPMNDQVMFGVSVGAAAGPCGAVSIYGECAGMTLNICRARGTPAEMLVETDCAAMNGFCVGAAGLVEAHCEAGASPDGGIADSGLTDSEVADSALADAELAGDAAVFEDASVSSNDAAQPQLDGGVLAADAGPTTEEDSGCDCSATSGAKSSNMTWIFALAGLLTIIRRRSNS